MNMSNNEAFIIEAFKSSALKSPTPSFANGSGGNLHESVESMKTFATTLYGKYSKYLSDMPDGWTKQVTAMCMESWDRATKYLDEATKASAIAGYNKNAFQLIRSTLPVTATEKVFSVQPMLGPTSSIFVLQSVYGTNTNKVSVGDPLFNKHDPNYGDSVIDSEELAVGDGVTTTVGTGTLGNVPIVKGSLSLQAGALTATDDGAGALVGNATGTIDYTTGALAVTWSSAPTADDVVLASWTVDNEINADGIPDIDLLLTSYPVTARRKAIKFRYSMIASFSLRDQYGVEAEAELVKSVGAEIAFGIDNQNFRVVYNAAIDKRNDVKYIFNAEWLAGASQLSRKDLFEGFITTMIDASNEILVQSGRAIGNYFVGGPKTVGMLQTIGLPRFKSAKILPTRGIQLAGILDDRWEVYMTPNPLYFGMKTHEWLIGCKNESFLEAGFVWAPWIAAFETPTTVLDDFQARKGMASLSGSRMIDPRFFMKGAVKNL